MGAYNPNSTDVISIADDTINSESMIKLFEKVETFYSEKKTIYFIADNARYNRSKVVLEYLKTSKDFRDAVMGFFENISFYKEKIKRSVGNKMHLLQTV